MKLSHIPTTQYKHTRLNRFRRILRGGSETFFQKKATAFSLVEVVLAVGIFAFAMVAVIGVFGSTNKSTGALLDRDAIHNTVPTFRTAIRNLKSAKIEPVTTNAPVKIYLLKQRDAENFEGAVAVEVDQPPTVTGETDGRLYRAKVIPAPGADMTAGRPGYPLQVLVEAFPRDAGDTVSAIESITFHTVWNR